MRNLHVSSGRGMHARLQCVESVAEGLHDTR